MAIHGMVTCFCLNIWKNSCTSVWLAISLIDKINEGRSNERESISSQETVVIGWNSFVSPAYEGGLKST